MDTQPSTNLFYHNPIPPTGATTIVQLPLAFVRSGYASVNSGAIYYVGDRGYGWSHTVSSSTNAYYLVLSSKEVNSSYSDSRWAGRPLRCHYPGKIQLVPLLQVGLTTYRGELLFYSP